MIADYLIWSNEHGMWWRPASAGYTVHTHEAGRYTREEAIRICHDARGGWRPGKVPPEIPVHEYDVILMERP